MICSQCKRGATNQEKFQGIICRSGHILCEQCGDVNEPCSLCGHVINQWFELISGDFPRIQFYPIPENADNDHVSFIKKPPSKPTLSSSVENSHSSMLASDASEKAKNVGRFLEQPDSQQVLRYSDISLLDREKEILEQEGFQFFVPIQEPVHPILFPFVLANESEDYKPGIHDYFVLENQPSPHPPKTPVCKPKPTVVSEAMSHGDQAHDDLCDLLSTEFPNCSSENLSSLMEKLRKLEMVEAQNKRLKKFFQDNCCLSTTAYRAYTGPGSTIPKAMPVELTSRTRIHAVQGTPLSIQQLNFSRDPVQCPISVCGRKKTVSEFCRHLNVDHQRLVKDRIRPGVESGIRLNLSLLGEVGMNVCHRVYLVQEKVLDLGRNEYRNCLPVMLMTRKFHYKELYEPTADESVAFGQFVWLTGLYPADLPLFYNVVILNKSVKGHIVFSSQVHSIRDEQTTAGLYHSGRALVLTGAQVAKLSKERRDKIEIQIIVH